jgi:hypothetical protein
MLVKVKATNNNTKYYLYYRGMRDRGPTLNSIDIRQGNDLFTVRYNTIAFTTKTYI